MNEIKIPELAYMLKQAKNDGRPQPIFFLGAGASRTGDIPPAKDIEKKILEDYGDNPFIQKLKDGEKNYAKLMECLLPNQRNNLLKGYIKKAKINVTHVYLAQLMDKGYADYILTVNFDNLMLRALALYNIFPPTYDMAILRDLTTTTFHEGSIVYLHGQHHGLWLLNTDDEMRRVNKTVPRIFDSIKNQRPWIFIGYSGSDPIFEHIKKLGRFDDGLYWVGYKESRPSKEVQEFLKSPNTNASYIKGFDSDAFMIKLNESLGLGQPLIFDKPFSCLNEMLNNVKDVNDDEDFKYVKERLEIAKKNVKNAINEFEKGEINNISEKEVKIDALKKEIIDVIITENYDENVINNFYHKIKSNNERDLSNLLSGLFSNWGNNIGNSASSFSDDQSEKIYLEIIDKYKTAIDLNPENFLAYCNWGRSLAKIAEKKNGVEAEKLNLEAIEKFRKAIEINPNSYIAYNNYGNSLSEIAEGKKGDESERLFLKSIDKYKKAAEINPDHHVTYSNWGGALLNLSKLKKGDAAEKLILSSIEKYKESIKRDPNSHIAYNNYGNSLLSLAEIKVGAESEQLFLESIEKYRKAIELKPDFDTSFNNWGTLLLKIAEKWKEKETKELYLEAIEKFEKAIELNSNDSIAYNNLGNSLAKLAKIEGGSEAEKYYFEAIKKYEKALEIDPDDHITYNNFANSLSNLAKNKSEKEAKIIFSEAIKKLNKAVDLGGSVYNLSCIYSLLGKKEKALYYLEKSLKNKELEKHSILEDEDWKEFLNDPDFKALLEKFD